MITQQELEELLKFSEEDERFGVAFRGALSQIRHKIYLESSGYNVKVLQSDNAGEPDFIINSKRMEHKRAKSVKTSDGNIQAEFQKSRRRIPERLYDHDFSDLVSVDVSEHTGIKDDYRYARASDLRRHHKHQNKLASLQKIENYWVSDVRLLLE
jgi:hypothetical protein